MPRISLLLVALLVSACGDGAETDTDAPPAAELATADAVADAVLERYDANVGATDSFVVTGAGVEARYTAIDDTTGLDQFGPPEISPVGDAPAPPESAQLLANHIPNGRRLAKGLRSAEFGGLVTRDGRRAYVLTSDDAGVLLGAPGNAGGPDLEVRVYVDAETFDVLEIYTSAATDDASEPTVGRIIYSDFREADGLRLPYRVREVTTGLSSMIDDDTRMVQGGALSLQKRQLEAAPPGPERDAQLAQVNAQLRMLNEGVLENEVVVESVRVGE